MHILGQRPKTLVEISLEPTVKGYRQSLVSQFRGAVTSMFPESDFHQHDPNGRLIYRYPKIQYQWMANQGLIMGWMELAEKLFHMPWLDIRATLNGIEVLPTKVTLTPESAIFGIPDNLLHYCFVTPVLLFNSNNYIAYKSMDFNQRPYETDRLLQAQILIALRGLDIHFPQRLYATFTRLRITQCFYKGQWLNGISGRFATNVFLPDFFGFGHAVSHGFGWIKQIQKDNQ